MTQTEQAMGPITDEQRQAANAALARYESLKAGAVQVEEVEEDDDSYCVHCSQHVEPSIYRDDDDMCEECWADCHTFCGDCGEETWTDDLREGLCEACYAAADQELDAVVESLKDSGQLRKALALLKTLQ